MALFPFIYGGWRELGETMLVCLVYTPSFGISMFPLVYIHMPFQTGSRAALSFSFWHILPLFHSCTSVFTFLLLVFEVEACEVCVWVFALSCWNVAQSWGEIHRCLSDRDMLCRSCMRFTRPPFPKPFLNSSDILHTVFIELVNISFHQLSC